MATFITTINSRTGETIKRANTFKVAATNMGVKVSDIYWALGGFDGAIVFDAPDDETASAALLHLGSFGNVQTTAARAFNAAGMGKILGKLSK